MLVTSNDPLLVLPGTEAVLFETSKAPDSPGVWTGVELGSMVTFGLEDISVCRLGLCS